MPRLLIQAASSAALTWFFSLLLLRRRGSGAVIKEELRDTQWSKEGTPVVGGIAFTLAALVTTLFDPLLTDPLIYIPLVTILIFSLIGFADDRAKARSASSDGLHSLTKLALQAVGAALVLLLIARTPYLDTSLTLPFGTIKLGLAYYPFALIYILYFVNAVNITDGLDSLAGGSSMPLLLLVAAISFRQGHMPSLSLVGALSVFLIFNAHPARYFMGDAGSHTLGSYIAVHAILLKGEVLILLAGALFLVELASSLIQIVSIRRFGHKVFTIAPLHHAYELKGVGERTIVRRFVMASWVCGALSLIILW